MFNFSKALYWLGLVHVLLGAAIEHTKNHHTLEAVDEGIQVIEGLGSSAGPTAPAPSPAPAGSSPEDRGVAGKLLNLGS